MSTSRELSDKELGELDFSGYVDDLGQFHATLHNNNDLTVEQLDIRISFDNMQTYKQYRKTFNGVLDSPIKPYATGRFEIDLNLPPLFEKIKGFMDGFQYKISAAIGH